MRPLHQDGTEVPDHAAPKPLIVSCPESETAPCTAPNLDNKALYKATSVPASGAARKAWLSAQALMLMAGWPADLIEGDAGETVLIATKGAITLSFTTLHEAEAFAGSAGARS